MSYYNGSSYTFTWQGRELIGAVKGSNTMSFSYNDIGLRISKTVNGVTTHYIYDGDLLLSEYTDTQAIVYIYDANTAPIGFKYRSSSYENDAWDIYWYEKNLQGDIVAIYNKSGTKLVTYSYNAWGVTTKSYSNNGSTSTAAKNNLTYRGYYYDSETGLYYVSSRYYDPEIGRWINADSQLNTSLGVLGCNMFAYCLNNPVNKVDYGGNKPGDLFDTMDEAAKDAAEYLGELTWENTWEYSTAIYTVNTTIKTYETVTKTHRFLWWTWTTTSTKTVRTKVTKYTYKAVKTDKKNNSVGVPNAPLFKKRVAALHTHPMGSWAGITRFSDADKKWADYYKIPLYVHGPNGELRKYDPATGEDILIYSDLPISPKTPWLE